MKSLELNFLPPVYRLNIDVGLGLVFTIIVLIRDILVCGGASSWAILCYWSEDGFPALSARSGHTPIRRPSNRSNLPLHCVGLEH